VQYFLLRRQLRVTAPAFLTENLTFPFVQALVGSVFMGVVAYQGFNLLFMLGQPWVNTKVNLFASMAVAGGVAAALYAALLVWWKYPERDLVLGFGDRMLRRLRLRR
jgi:hypothetical protein